MSRSIFGKPEFRLVFDHPHITVTRAGDSESEQVFDVASATLMPDLRRLGAEIAAARGRLTVVLPEGEVWRGRLPLAATRPRDRGRAVRIRAAQAMGAPAAALAVRLGRIGRDGTMPAAAVRRDTLVETRGFLARAGLRPARITGAGTFDGFPAAPRLDGASFAVRPPQAVAAAGGTLAAAVLLAFLFRPDAAPQPPGLIGPVLPAAVATAEPDPLPEIAHVAPRPRPANLVRVAALPAAPKIAPAGSPAPAKAAALTSGPLVTMASRNLPDAAVAPAPAPVSALRLSELNVARARLADMLMSAPLVRETVSAAASLPSPAAAFRESGVTAVTPPPAPAAVPAVVPAIVPAASAPAPEAPQVTARRPAPRPQPDPAPDRESTAAAPEASAPPAKTDAPAVEVAAVAPDVNRPRPREAAENQIAISAALSAAVVTAGVSTAVQAASASPAAPEAASPRPEPRRVAVASAAPKATPAAASTRPAAPAPQRVAAVAPVRTAPQPAATRPGVPAQQIAAFRPGTSAQQPAAARPARAAAPAPQRVATVQPARAAAPAPQRVAAVQTARPAPQPAAVRPAPQTQRRVAARPAPALAPAVARTPTSNATDSATAAAAATERVGMSRRSLALIGIFGQDKNRYAMVRLPDGRMQRVTAGDRIQGTQVAAIGEDSVQLSGGGRTTTLTMPN